MRSPSTKDGCAVGQIPFPSPGELYGEVSLSQRQVPLPPLLDSSTEGVSGRKPEFWLLPPLSHLYRRDEDDCSEGDRQRSLTEGIIPPLLEISTGLEERRERGEKRINKKNI
jgi:hypothetical protein